MTENKKSISDRILEIESFARQLILREIRLLESSSFLNVSTEKFKIPNIEQNIGIQVNEKTDFSAMMLQVKLELHGNSEANDELLKLSARYGSIYQIQSHEKFDHEIMEKFAQSDGLNIVWPYWREFVQSMTTRMGLPPLTLPIMRPGELQFTKEEKTTS